MWKNILCFSYIHPESSISQMCNTPNDVKEILGREVVTYNYDVNDVCCELFRRGDERAYNPNPKLAHQI